MSVELISAAYHRNGVGGAGFYVALFTDKENNPDRTFIATMFVDSICPACKGSGEVIYKAGSQRSKTPETCIKCKGTGEVTPKEVDTTAVLDVNEAAKGNIFMHETYDAKGDYIEGTGDNAWRGADYYSGELLPLVKAAVAEDYANNRLHYFLENEKKIKSIGC